MFSVGDAYRLLADFEMKTTTKFSCFKADKSFDNIGKLVPKIIFKQDYRDFKKLNHVSSSVGLSRFPLYFLADGKVQKQPGAGGCGLFALAFAAD